MIAFRIGAKAIYESAGGTKGTAPQRKLLFMVPLRTLLDAVACIINILQS
jgi:hypothetical protein